MLLLFSHDLTPIQKKDAKLSYGIEAFISMPEELQRIWSNIPPMLQEIEPTLLPLEEWIEMSATQEDVVVIQGDFGATYAMVTFAKRLGIVPVYATTIRKTKEQEQDGKVVKTSVFEHVRFRKF